MKILLLALLLTIPAFAAEPVTHDLDGVQIAYTYENGMQFVLKYEAKGLSYQHRSGDAPEKWWGPFPYKAFKTNNGEYFLGWYEKGFGDQITQLVNLQTKTLYGSGIIVKGKRIIEHFEKAKIDTITGWPPVR